MKACAILVAAASLATVLAGCQSTAQLSPAAEANVKAAFDAVCPGITSGALDAELSTLNANVQNSYAAAKQICAAGAPTNLVVAGMDILTLQTVLAPYLKNVRIR